MTDTDAKTLAAALCRDSTGSCVNWTPGFEMTDALHAEGHQREAAAILAAIPPDPRLDALLAAAREALTHEWWTPEREASLQPLRDALAAFDHE